MANLLQPAWQHHSAVRSVMTDSRRKNHGARQLMDLMDTVKSLGFRHDQHVTLDRFTQHCVWLAEHGMVAQLGGVMKVLDDLEIVDQRKQAAPWLEQTFVNYFGFWRAAVDQMYGAATLTLEDQKYLAMIEVEKAITDRKFTTGMHRYHHILVDEFQDINALDLGLLKAIAELNKCELTIIGDDDQAIYEWRGATPEFILNPEVHISLPYVTHKLEVNYRSPSNIVELSQRLIKHNKKRVDKQIRAASSETATVQVVGASTFQESVEYVKSMVERLLRDDDCRNIALIARKRSQIIPYQIVFAGAGIPFYAAEDLQVLLSEAFSELKSMLLLKAQAELAFPLGPDPVESVLKLCDKVKRFPLNKNDRGALKSHLLQQHPKSLQSAVEAVYGYRGPLKGENRGGSMSGAFYTALKAFLVAATVAETIRAISDNFDGLQQDYGKSLDDIFYADPPFLYLSEYAARYGDDYAAFYQDVEMAIATLAKIPPVDEEQLVDEAWKRPLHLMTALRAKGKEFDTVIILDCNSGIWPSKLAMTEDQLEAERRLFYVAVTRARKNLVMLVDDTILGETMAPSPYLQEMGVSIARL